MGNAALDFLWRPGAVMEPPSHEAIFHGTYCRCGAIFSIQFAEDILHVFFYRFHADLKGFGDFAIAES